MESKFEITWQDSGREPKHPADPEYPNGIDLDCSDGAAAFCKIALTYPARRCGAYIVRCTECGYTAHVTTAGRADDPRSLKMACNKPENKKDAGLILVHKPANLGHKIEEVWVIVSTDETGEGVAAVTVQFAGNPTLMPLLAADEKRLVQIKELGKELARVTDTKLKLIKLTKREEIEDIDP